MLAFVVASPIHGPPVGRKRGIAVQRDPRNDNMTTHRVSSLADAKKDFDGGTAIIIERAHDGSLQTGAHKRRDQP